VRPVFATNAYMLNHSDACLLKGMDGNPVPPPVFGFDGGPGSCGVEKWLEGMQQMIQKGGTHIPPNNAIIVLPATYDVSIARAVMHGHEKL